MYLDYNIHFSYVVYKPCMIMVHIGLNDNYIKEDLEITNRSFKTLV